MAHGSPIEGKSRSNIREQFRAAHIPKRNKLQYSLLLCSDQLKSLLQTCTPCHKPALSAVVFSQLLSDHTADPHKACDLQRGSGDLLFALVVRALAMKTDPGCLPRRLIRTSSKSTMSRSQPSTRQSQRTSCPATSATRTLSDALTLVPPDRQPCWVRLPC